MIKQTHARNLLTRLDRDREQILRFAHDLQVPFDNNLVERDIRMIKIQQKISGADRFFALRAYISTTRKQSRDMLDALACLANHAPWLPIPSTRDTSTDLNSHRDLGVIGEPEPLQALDPEEAGVDEPAAFASLGAPVTSASSSTAR